MSDSPSVISQETIVKHPQPQDAEEQPSSVIDHAIEKLIIYVNSTTNNCNIIKKNDDCKWVDMARTIYTDTLRLRERKKKLM
jgi:hypothetical protein